MFHTGYYWAINRDYDVSYRIIDYTARGYDHTVYFRGKPTDKITFDFTFHGVQDRGVLVGTTLQKQGGYNFQGNIKAFLSGDGWEAHGSLDYLSSFLFRQSFTQSFNEAIFAETHSTAYITKKFSNYDFTVAVSRLQNFQDTTPGNYVIIRKTPEVDFGRQHGSAGSCSPMRRCGSRSNRASASSTAASRPSRPVSLRRVWTLSRSSAAGVFRLLASTWSRASALSRNLRWSEVSIASRSGGLGAKTCGNRNGPRR